MVGVHPFPLVDGSRGPAVHELGPSLDLLAGSVVFLIFLDPDENFTIAKSAGDLASKGNGVNAGELQKILVQGAIKGVIPVFFGQRGAAFVQNSGKDDVTAQPNPGTARWVACEIGSAQFWHWGRMPDSGGGARAGRRQVTVIPFG